MQECLNQAECSGVLLWECYCVARHFDRSYWLHVLCDCALQMSFVKGVTPTGSRAELGVILVVAALGAAPIALTRPGASDTVFLAAM